MTRQIRRGVEIMLIGTGQKRFRKTFKMNRLAAEIERINSDNLKLRKLVVDLAKANMELGGSGALPEQKSIDTDLKVKWNDEPGGTDEGSKGSEGKALPALWQGPEAYELANQEPCGELLMGEDGGTEAGNSKEGTKE